MFGWYHRKEVQSRSEDGYIQASYIDFLLQILILSYAFSSVATLLMDFNRLNTAAINTNDVQT